MKKIIASLFVIAFSATMVFASNFDGKWKTKIDTQNGPFEIYVVYKVTGNKISGTLSFDQGSIEFSDGTVSGDEFEYTYTYEGNTTKNKGKYVDGKIIVKWESRDNQGEVTLTKVK